MLDLKKLTIDDIEIIRPYFIYSRSNKCDNTVGGSVMWANFFNTRYAIIDKTLIFCVTFLDKGECFTVPIGNAEDHAIDVIYDYTISKNEPLQFVTVTERELAIIEKKFIVEKTLLSEWSDYIYEAQDLINLSGRKYHGQKNHINFFKRAYPDYVFEDITSGNIDEVKKFLVEFSKNESKDSIIYEEELKKVFEVLENNDKYKFFGMMLKTPDNICAFSMGEIVKNTLYVHIEKADKSIRGAYPIMMSSFARKYASELKYINREENAGDKGLETSKLQYHPCNILNKYFVKVISKR